MVFRRGGVLFPFGPEVERGAGDHDCGRRELYKYVSFKG